MWKGWKVHALWYKTQMRVQPVAVVLRLAFENFFSKKTACIGMISIQAVFFFLFFTK